ncbi:hypothetical protein M433DRAFT_5148 [Acidomyces richmondensis BFW]|nr:MAG: hypothetical protein FE78DRAFT_150821 [Acidomyces sp. 'richmondensis']KYG44770.1 hypothetical protein M433DRAFT_5148 [Acidomyces richmondensis BFW]
MSNTVNPLRRKNSGSPISAPARKRARARRQSKFEFENDRLDDTGHAPSLAPWGVEQDVLSLLRYIQAHTWADVPDRAAGMGSERISEVLRFRKGFPPIVSVAHLYALSESSTNTDRELARLIAQGAVRRVAIPGRGKRGSGVGEGVALLQDWKRLLQAAEGIDDEVKEQYIRLLESKPGSATTETTGLEEKQVSHLVHAGFFTIPTAPDSSRSSRYIAPAPSNSLLSHLSCVGSSAATGTLAAIGGPGAIHESGGGGSTLATQCNRISPLPKSKGVRTMTFALPGTGVYLKLLTEARQHLVALLTTLSPKWKEATMDMLKERWEGNTLNDATSMAKRARGEWTGVLPGRTKKWRNFYGLEFEWVLAECVGSGLIELFETASVGVGVRLR